MNLIEQIDRLFANASDEQLDALLEKGNCAHYNKVGGDFMTAETALREAERLRKTYSSAPVDQPPVRENATWNAHEQTSKVGGYEEIPMAA